MGLLKMCCHSWMYKRQCKNRLQHHATVEAEKNKSERWEDEWNNHHDDPGFVKNANWYKTTWRKLKKQAKKIACYKADTDSSSDESISVDSLRSGETSMILNKDFVYKNPLTPAVSLKVSTPDQIKKVLSEGKTGTNSAGQIPVMKSAGQITNTNSARQIAGTKTADQITDTKPAGQIANTKSARQITDTQIKGRIRQLLQTKEHQVEKQKVQIEVDRMLEIVKGTENEKNGKHNHIKEFWGKETQYKEFEACSTTKYITSLKAEEILENASNRGRHGDDFNVSFESTGASKLSAIRPINHPYIFSDHHRVTYGSQEDSRIGMPGFICYKVPGMELKKQAKRLTSSEADTDRSRDESMYLDTHFTRIPSDSRNKLKKHFVPNENLALPSLEGVEVKTESWDRVTNCKIILPSSMILDSDCLYEYPLTPAVSLHDITPNQIEKVQPEGNASTKTADQIEDTNSSAQIVEANNACQITDTQSVGQIADTKTAGQIVDTRTSGQIADIKNAGQIADTNFAAQIADINSAGQIADTNNAGQIVDTNNAGQIAETNNASHIADTNNAGQIADTCNAGQIAYTNNASQIADTNNAGEIADNNIAGQIADTYNAGQIADTNNAGQIADTNNAGQIADTNNASQIVNTNNTGQTADTDIAGQIADTNNAGQIADTNNAGQTRELMLHKEEHQAERQNVQMKVDRMLDILKDSENEQNEKDNHIKELKNRKMKQNKKFVACTVLTKECIKQLKVKYEAAPKRSEYDLRFIKQYRNIIRNETCRIMTSTDMVVSEVECLFGVERTRIFFDLLDGELFHFGSAGAISNFLPNMAESAVRQHVTSFFEQACDMMNRLMTLLLGCPDSNKLQQMPEPTFISLLQSVIDSFLSNNKTKRGQSDKGTQIIRLIMVAPGLFVVAVGEEIPEDILVRFRHGDETVMNRFVDARLEIMQASQMQDSRPSCTPHLPDNAKLFIYIPTENGSYWHKMDMLRDNRIRCHGK